MNNRRKSPIWKLDSDEFKILIRDSKHYSQAMSFFGIQNHGGNFKTLKARIVEEGIDDSHMKHFIKYEMPKIIHPGKPLKELLIKDSPSNNRGSIKKRLIEGNFLKNQCYECGLLPEWNKKRLVFVLDHINGKNNDYRLENLRLLCPNCNSQTDTFCGRTKRRVYNCVKCGKDIKGEGRTGFCLKCTYKNPIPPKRKFEIIKEELEKLVWEKPMTTIAKSLGVSGNAVKKRCLSFGISFPSVGYWTKKLYGKI